MSDLPPVIHAERIKTPDEEPFGEWYGEPTQESVAYISAEEAARVARMVLLTQAARDATPMQRGDMVAAALEQLATLAPRDAPPV